MITPTTDVVMRGDLQCAQQSRGRCCWRGSPLFLSKTEHGYSYRKLGCEKLCAATSGCTHAGHSSLFGNCVSCKGCSLTTQQDATTKHYLSWPVRTCQAAANATEDTSYLDDELYRLIYRSHDVYAHAPSRPIAITGWGTKRQLYRRLVAEIPEARASRPIRPLVVEVGVWKGASAAIFATSLRDQQRGGKLLAVDTWLGAVEMWDREALDASRDLEFEAGYPSVFRTFISNMKHIGVHSQVIPFPQTSMQAAIFLQRHRIRADVLHLDAAHEYEAVRDDLRWWAPTVRVGGVMLGDDYVGHWKGVRRAVDEWVAATGTALEVHAHKWLIRRRANDTLWPRFETPQRSMH